MNKILIYTILILIPFYSFCQANIVSTEEKLWKDHGFDNAQISMLDLTEFYTDSKHRFTHYFDLTVVNLRGSGWTKAFIKSAVLRTAEIYAQCSVMINKIKYVEVDPPLGILDITIDVNDALLCNLLPIENRPVLFYIRSETSGQFSGYARRKGKSEPPLTGTAYISIDVLRPEFIELREKGYCTTAHELAHLLCDESHIEGNDYNILSNYYNKANSKITLEQCNKIKQSDLVMELYKN